MAEPDVLASDRINDYIDGRLNDRDRATVAAFLVARPRAAAEVEALRRQSEILRGIGQSVLDEPIPPRLREVLRRGGLAGGVGESAAPPRPSERRLRLCGS